MDFFTSIFFLSFLLILNATFASGDKKNRNLPWEIMTRIFHCIPDIETRQKFAFAVTCSPHQFGDFPRLFNGGIVSFVSAFEHGYNFAFSKFEIPVRFYMAEANNIGSLGWMNELFVFSKLANPEDLHIAWPLTSKSLFVNHHHYSNSKSNAHTNNNKKNSKVPWKAFGNQVKRLSVNRVCLRSKSSARFFFSKLIRDTWGSSLRSLHLRSVCIFDHIELLTDAIKCIAPRLRSLSLRNERIIGFDVTDSLVRKTETLLIVVSNIPNLEDLTLTIFDCFLQSPLVATDHLLPLHLPIIAKLKFLRLEVVCSVFIPSPDAVSNFLEILSKQKQLVSLDIPPKLYQKDLLKYTQCLGNLQRLRSIRCCYAEWPLFQNSEKAFVEAVKSMPWLESLDVSCNRNMDTKWLIQSMGSFSCVSNLKRLNLAYTSLDYIGQELSLKIAFELLSGSLKSLNFLDLSGNPRFVLGFLIYPLRSLKVLVLQNTFYGLNNIYRFIRYLKPSHPRWSRTGIIGGNCIFPFVNHLDLSVNDFGYLPIKDAIWLLRRIALNFPSLRSIDFSANFFSLDKQTVLLHFTQRNYPLLLLKF